MASIAEILEASPSKITFEGGRPPPIGEVPAHTYGLLFEVNNLGLLDGQDKISTAQPPATEEPELTREEQLRRELESVAAIFGVPSTGMVEQADGSTVVFDVKPHPATKISEVTPAPSADKPEPKPISRNKKHRADNVRIFTGQLGKNVYVRGRVVNKKGNF